MEKGLDAYKLKLIISSSIREIIIKEHFHHIAGVHFLDAL